MDQERSGEYGEGQARLEEARSQLRENETLLEESRQHLLELEDELDDLLEDGQSEEPLFYSREREERIRREIGEAKRFIARFEALKQEFRHLILELKAGIDSKFEDRTLDSDPKEIN